MKKEITGQHSSGELDNGDQDLQESRLRTIKNTNKKDHSEDKSTVRKSPGGMNIKIYKNSLPTDCRWTEMFFCLFYHYFPKLSTNFLFQ